MLGGWIGRGGVVGGNLSFYFLYLSREQHCISILFQTKKPQVGIKSDRILQGKCVHNGIQCNLSSKVQVDAYTSPSLQPFGRRPDQG